MEFTGQADHLHDVGNAGGPDDDNRFAIDHTVPDSPGHLIFLIARANHLAPQLCPQGGQMNRILPFGLAIHEGRLARTYTKLF